MATKLNSTSAVAPVLITVSQATNKLTFVINRDVQFNIISRDGKHVNRPDQASNTVNVIEKDGKIVGTVNHKGEVLFQHKGDTLLSTLSKFIKCSDTATNGCFGGDGKFAGPLEPNKAMKKQASANLAQPAGFSHFNLFPQEIKDMILGQVVEPHTVTVYWGGFKYIVVMHRKWTDIALYQVCRKFRQYAIKTFGVPKQHKSFPFDPIKDTLYLRTSSNHRIGQLLGTGRKTKWPVFEIHDAEIARDAIDHEVWDRVQTVETEARMPQEVGPKIASGDCRMFRKIHTWRILIVQLDTCKTIFDPDTQSLFQKSDYSIISGTIHCLSGSTQPDWKPKFIEICRKGCMCSKATKLAWRNTRSIPGQGKICLVKIDNTANLLHGANFLG